MSRPSHHLTAVWNSGECRCRFRPTEGAAESHALAWGAEVDNSQALFAGEEDIKVNQRDVCPTSGTRIAGEADQQELSR